MAVDPRVSRAKFERELEIYNRAYRETYARRGAWLLDAQFPDVFVVFGTRQHYPVIVPFGVVINFDDYNLRPPSVTLVHPISKVPLSAEELRYPMFRARPIAETGEFEVIPLAQAFPGGKPFVCLPGIREYHANPAHTGDSWFLYRGTEVGTLAFLVDKFLQYGAEPIRLLQIHAQIKLGGLHWGEGAPPQ